jgi:chorismate mutase
VSTVADSVVEEFRTQITALDERLLALFNERVELVTALAAHKRAHEIPLRDGTREQWLARHLNELNPGPLSAAGVERLCAFVLELTRDEVGL